MTLNLSDPTFTDERKARTYFENIRWPNGVTCCHCGNADSSRIYPIAANLAKKVREGLYECQDCHGQFTVMTGSVMESSHLPLTKWALAYRLMASAKKGISAHQMHRTLGVSYKTAWFLCHRIREAMRDISGDQLGGAGKIVEADETYVGGKPRRGTDGRKTKQDRKTPVAVLVERGGRARATVVSHPLEGVLKRNIAQNVAQGTEMHTDEHKAYRGIEKITGGLHMHVTHYTNEFAREDIHSNTAESWNALLKRSIVGSFHHVSREHLSRYCDEVSFRWDRRSMDDTDRTEAAIKEGEGKRLTYRRTNLAPSEGA
ncbi:MAG TPA: IS1595 family transposase [Stellaceae bacterium]|jgi:transposase-like protein|nr:IS1595 family transposase [Stellaceae bacterium]